MSNYNSNFRYSINLPFPGSIRSLSSCQLFARCCHGQLSVHHALGADQPVSDLARRDDLVERLALHVREHMIQLAVMVVVYYYNGPHGCVLAQFRLFLNEGIPDSCPG